MTGNNIELDFYYNEVSPMLPDKILDFHTHTWSC